MKTRQRNRRLADLTGRRYGRLVVLELVSRDYERNNHIYRLACDCGKVIEHKIKGIAYAGTTRSCGCLFREMVAERNRSHGMAHLAEYKVWKDMRARCSNEQRDDFADYGGRGIKVCDRWRDFSAFIADMGPRPAGMSIDRRDVNGNYEPSNCRWATDQTQANNKRSNRVIEFMGRRLTLQQLADEVGMKREKLAYRLKIGLSAEDAVRDVDLRRKGSVSYEGA